jgi:nucleoside 2-deoxyribosyltransferase
MKKIYLCGGINKLSDADAKDWREAAKIVLAPKFVLVDPMRNDYRGRELEPGIADLIIRGDIIDICGCDIVLVNANKPSWGTGMELFYSKSLGKQTIVVCADDKPSPWLVGHADYLVKTFQDAFNLLV